MRHEVATFTGSFMWEPLVWFWWHQLSTTVIMPQWTMLSPHKILNTGDLTLASKCQLNVWDFKIYIYCLVCQPVIIWMLLAQSAIDTISLVSFIIKLFYKICTSLKKSFLCEHEQHLHLRSCVYRSCYSLTWPHSALSLGIQIGIWREKASSVHQ